MVDRCSCLFLINLIDDSDSRKTASEQWQKNMFTTTCAVSVKCSTLCLPSSMTIAESYTYIVCCRCISERLTRWRILCGVTRTNQGIAQTHAICTTYMCIWSFLLKRRPVLLKIVNQSYIFGIPLCYRHVNCRFCTHFQLESAFAQHNQHKLTNNELREPMFSSRLFHSFFSFLCALGRLQFADAREMTMAHRKIEYHSLLALEVFYTHITCVGTLFYVCRREIQGCAEWRLNGTMINWWISFSGNRLSIVRIKISTHRHTNKKFTEWFL